MVEKCFLCSKEIETTFLDKILGTIVKSKDGKKILICNFCQKEHKNNLKDKLK